jgi:hypothetical protein
MGITQGTYLVKVGRSHECFVFVWLYIAVNAFWLIVDSITTYLCVWFYTRVDLEESILFVTRALQIDLFELGARQEILPRCVVLIVMSAYHKCVYIVLRCMISAASSSFTIIMNDFANKNWGTLAACSLCPGESEPAHGHGHSQCHGVFISPQSLRTSPPMWRYRSGPRAQHSTASAAHINS